MNRTVLKTLSVGTLLALASTVSCTTSVDDEVTREGEQQGETSTGVDDLAAPGVDPTERNMPTPDFPDCDDSEDCCPDGYEVIEGTAGNDHLDGIFQVPSCLVGLEGNDNLDGSGVGNVLLGGPGVDDIDGGFGVDVVLGGDGDDDIRTAHGDDEIDGGPGNDYIDSSLDDDVVFGGEGADTIRTSSGADWVDGGPGDDDIQLGFDDDTAFGGEGNDVIEASTGQNWISGGPGDDTLDGGLNDDYIEGNAGDDVITGSTGNDVIVPGPGLDHVYGEIGDDTIVIRAACEVKEGEVVDGGFSGRDRVESPFSEAELVAMGVSFSSIEEFVQVAPGPGHGACEEDEQGNLTCECCDDGFVGEDSGCFTEREGTKEFDLTSFPSCCDAANFCVEDAAHAKTETIVGFRTVGFARDIPSDDPPPNDPELQYQQKSGTVLARVYFPSATVATEQNPYGTWEAGATYPLVVLIHGLGKQTYTGYEHLLEHLAGNGFVAASIQVAPPHGSGFFKMRAGALLRAALGMMDPAENDLIPTILLNEADGALDEYNEVENQWSTDDAAHLSGVVALVGHSQGGKGAVFAAACGAHPDTQFCQDERIVPDGWCDTAPCPDIRSLVSLAPKDLEAADGLLDFDAPAAESLLTIVGSHDDDVPLGGVTLHDFSGIETSVGPDVSTLRKAHVWIYDADHSGFHEPNLLVSPDEATGFDVPTQDNCWDTSVDPPVTIVGCRHYAGDLTEHEHHVILSAYVNAWLRWTVKGVKEPFGKEMFTGDPPISGTNPCLEPDDTFADPPFTILPQYSEGSAGGGIRRVVHHFENATADTENALGGAVSSSDIGLDVLDHLGWHDPVPCTEPAGWLEDSWYCRDATGGLVVNPQEHFPGHQHHETSGASLSWDSPGTLSLEIPDEDDEVTGGRMRDLTEFSMLSFRAGQTYLGPGNVEGEGQDLWVRLVDADGVTRRVRVGDVLSVGGTIPLHFGAVPYPDVYRPVLDRNPMVAEVDWGDSTATVMRTVRIPLGVFDGVDFRDVAEVAFELGDGPEHANPDHAEGQIIVDSVEFTASNDEAPVCGNGEINAPAEECDGTEFGSQDCTTHGYDGGALQCTDECLLDFSACRICGNNDQEATEECDGIDLAGETCVSLVGTTGILACHPDCTFDTSGCTGGCVPLLGGSCDLFQNVDDDGCFPDGPGADDMYCPDGDHVDVCAIKKVQIGPGQYTLDPFCQPCPDLPANGQAGYGCPCAGDADCAATGQSGPLSLSNLGAEVELACWRLGQLVGACLPAVDPNYPIGDTPDDNVREEFERTRWLCKKPCAAMTDATGTEHKCFYRQGEADFTYASCVEESCGGDPGISCPLAGEHCNFDPDPAEEVCGPECDPLNNTPFLSNPDCADNYGYPETWGCTVGGGRCVPPECVPFVNQDMSECQQFLYGIIGPP